MKNTFHISKVGGIGNKQSVWLKGVLATLLVLGLTLTALAPALHQAHSSATHIADGDRPKVGTGG